MDWQALQDGLRAWFAASSGLHPTTIAWDGEAQTHRAFPQADLELVRQANEGDTDEVRYVPDEDGMLVPEVHGNRLMVLNVVLKSRDQRGPNKAYAVLDRVRTRLELPAVREGIESLDVTVRSSSVIANADKVSDQRELSVARLEIVLAYTAFERAEDQAAPPIEHVRLGGTVYDGSTPITVPDQTIP